MKFKFIFFIGFVLVLLFAGCEKEHVHTPGEWRVIKQATCSAKGSQERYCSECGECIAEEVLPMKAHSAGEWEIVQNPTCISEGLKQMKCAVCKEITGTDKIAMLAHLPVAISAVESTCTMHGMTEGAICGLCNTVMIAQTELPLKNHSWVVDAGFPATCTNTGLTDGSHCSVCGKINVAQEQIPLKNHIWITDKKVEATCTQNGLTEGTHCSECKQIGIKQQTILAKGHVVVTDATTPATCVQTGLTKGSHCSVCLAVLEKQQIIPVSGHDVDILTNRCSVCKATGYREFHSLEEYNSCTNKPDTCVLYLEYFALDASNYYSITPSYSHIILMGNPNKKITNLKLVIPASVSEARIDLVNCNLEHSKSETIITAEGSGTLNIGLYGTSANITAGQAGQESHIIADGENGAVAISAKKRTVVFTVACESALVKGGDGGNGDDGFTVNPLGGEDGGDGGNGAMAIVADKIQVICRNGYSASALTIKGGNGGSGGKGSKGLFKNGKNGVAGKSAVATNVPISYN